MKNPGSILGGISLAALLWLSANNGEALGVDLTNATPRLLSVSAVGVSGIPAVDLQFTYNSRGTIIFGPASKVGSNTVTGTVTLIKKANGSRTYTITARGTSVKTLTLRLKGTLGSAAACIYSNGRERASAPALAVDLSFISPVPARFRLVPQFDTKIRGKIIGSGLISGGYGNDSPGPGVLKGQLTRTRLTWQLKQGTQILTFTGVATANSNDFLGTLIVRLPPERATYKRLLVSLWSGPSIAAQPQSRTNNFGTDATFTVTAEGTDPLAYQWRFNGSNLADATGTSLTRSGVQAADAGSYSVLITNHLGSATSADAILTVDLSPSIVAQPQNRTNHVGTDASFSVTATGSAPISYQWRFEGASIAGATASAYTRTGVQASDAGAYSVVVTNFLGGATSADAILTVNLSPSIAAQPQSRTNYVGTDASFSVTATGLAPLSYQWRFMGASIAGATASAYTRAGVQTSDAGAYSVVVTNFVGSVTSAVTVLSVTVASVAPTILTQPVNQITPTGSNATFSVTAAGTQPLSYQWLKDSAILADGGGISGATSPSLTLSGVFSSDEGGYQVIVTNVGGAATSAIASLSVSLSRPIGADATVLVNSTSPRFSDFQRWIKPYLDNFGVPYTVQDIATNPVGPNIAQTALIIIGHRQIDTNLLFLNSAAQANISTAVSNGVGLVNFDTDLFTATNHRYQFIQSIFEFGYAANFPGSDATFPQSEPGPTLHFITALHPTNDFISLRSAMTLTGMVLPTNATAIALSGGKPFVTIRSYGQGRAMQWASDDWMAVAVLGPMEGLDDLIWRGLAWTARKPFVMRLMPNFVTTRWDDCSGPFWWVHTMNEFGFKPFLSAFLSDVAPSNIADLRLLCTNGMATASPHGFSGFNLIFFNYGLGTNYPDAVVSNNMYVAKQWHITNAIPMSKVIATHYSEIGTNALPWLLDWGTEYLPIEVPVNTLEYSPPYAPWLLGEPYRLYEMPLEGQANLPLYYADFLAFTNQPQVDGKFFNCYSEMRDAAACGQWCPYNNVQASIDDGTAIVKRGLDSKVLATLYSHEQAIQDTPSVPNGQPITSNNWRIIVSGVVSNLAPYQPIYVTLDYGSQYARATRTSGILSATVDLASGQVTANSSGVSDLAMQVQVFLDNAGSNLVATIPPFTNANSSLLAVLPAPQLKPTVAPVHPLLGRERAGVRGTDASEQQESALLLNSYGLVRPLISRRRSPMLAPVLLSQPLGRTNHEGSPASFSVQAHGTSPAYQWLKDSTLLPQATNPTLSFPSVSPSDAGAYAVLVSNVYGSLLSATATLSVVGPLRIESVSAGEGSVVVSWSAIPGSTYSLQQKLQIDTDWEDILPAVTAEGPAASATNSATNPQGFYRVHLVP